MTCSNATCRTISAWTPTSGVSNANPVARRLATEVLTEAVRHHQVFGVGFTYRGENHQFAINAEAYRTLLSSLASVDFSVNTALRAEAFASYSQDADRVNFRPENLGKPTARSAMLHELVHTLQDFRRFTGLHLEVEATAYMAQALWSAADEAGRAFTANNLRTHLQRQAQRTAANPNGQIFIEAARLCLSLGLDQTSNRLVRRTDLAPLERALRASSAYREQVDITFTGDGFRR